MRFLRRYLFVTARFHRVRENKKFGRSSALLLQALLQQLILMIQHAMEPLPRDVTLGRPINGITDRHVISRHGLGDGACRSAHSKEPARHFLSRTDLSEGPVLGRVEIDLQSLLVRARNLSIHAAAI